MSASIFVYRETFCAIVYPYAWFLSSRYSKQSVLFYIYIYDTNIQHREFMIPWRKHPVRTVNLNEDNLPIYVIMMVNSLNTILGTDITST